MIGGVWTMILRMYKTTKGSWVSPGALLKALKTKEDVVIVKHHPEKTVIQGQGALILRKN